MRLVVAVRHPLDRFTLEVSVEIGGGLTALLGESGAGKTTLLHVIAGLVRPAEGRVVLDDVVQSDAATGAWIPPHRRRIGYVFQHSRLFPHLTVRQNLVFGRSFARRATPATEPAPLPSPSLDEMVALLGLEGLMHRRPAKLSGGERRRVALGRALLAAPRLLLLDEPLGSVDVERRQEILPYLDRLLTEVRLPMIYVTHEAPEIEGRAARVIRMQHGRVVG